LAHTNSIHYLISASIYSNVSSHRARQPNRKDLNTRGTFPARCGAQDSDKRNALYLRTYVKVFSLVFPAGFPRKGKNVKDVECNNFVTYFLWACNLSYNAPTGHSESTVLKTVNIFRPRWKEQENTNHSLPSSAKVYIWSSTSTPSSTSTGWCLFLA
jgi:hypothetical protein